MLNHRFIKITVNKPLESDDDDDDDINDDDEDDNINDKNYKSL